MLPLLIGGAAVLLLASKNQKQGAKIGTIPQATKNPASAAAIRTDRGAPANQPWYKGPPVVGQGGAGSALGTAQTVIAGAQALSSLGNTFSDIFMSSQPDSVDIEGTVSAEDTTEFDDSDNFSLDTNANTDSYDVTGDDYSDDWFG